VLSYQELHQVASELKDPERVKEDGRQYAPVEDDGHGCLAYVG
jgi:hypothetical protein